MLLNIKKQGTNSVDAKLKARTFEWDTSFKVDEKNERNNENEWII